MRVEGNGESLPRVSIRVSLGARTTMGLDASTVYGVGCLNGLESRVRVTGSVRGYS